MQKISKLKANSITGGKKGDHCEGIFYVNASRDACVFDYRCYNKHGGFDKKKSFIEQYPVSYCK